MKNLVKLASLLLLVLGLSGQAWAQSLPDPLITILPFAPCAGSPVHFTAVDTAGAYTFPYYSWSFGDGGYGWSDFMNPTTTHTYTTPGTYNLILHVWDSLSFNSDTIMFSIVVDSICTASDFVSGNTYHDSNGNGVQDAGELPFANRIIEILPGPHYISSDANGNFGVQLPAGNYTLTPMSPSFYNVTEPASGSYSVTSSGSGSVVGGHSVGYYPPNPINNLWVSLYAAPPVPGFSRTFYLYYYNSGTTVVNPSLSLDYDPAFVFTSASNGGTQSGSSVNWSLGALAPNQGGSVSAILQVPVGTTVGSYLTSIANILPVVGDISPNDNRDTLVQEVVASYDPNDKAGLPAGQGLSGDINPGTPITYTIRFQNTGNFYATDVVLRDTLDADFDPASVEVLGASHPFTWHLDFGKLVFEFKNIMLPDSNTNEPASHGFARYRISHKANLPLGTELTNSASIYFDFNPPVLTNTTLHTLNLVTAVQPIQNTAGVKIAPNPFHGYTNFIFDDYNGESYDILVVDMSGKTVKLNKNINSSSFQLDATDLPAGMYMYKLRTSKGATAQGKMIVQ